MDANETPPAAGDESPAPTRVRRNTACIRCRDAKVRCNASANPNRPCLRCTKLNLLCVVDKNHKRTSKRSKLEELAAEVQTIKRAVEPKPASATPSPADPPALRPAPPPPPSSRPFQHPFTVYPLSGASNASAGLEESRQADSQPTTSPLTTLTSPPEGAAASGLVPEPRAISSKVFSGEEISYYFEKYFEHFHPYFPVVRSRDPDGCYKAGPILFWAIIATACRRYAKREGIYQFLVEMLPSEVWAAAAQPPLRLPTINAILLLAAWPQPSIRFMSDPSYIFVGIALNSCLTLGLHTGKGCHPEFTAQAYQLDTSDEEATFTWAACNLLSQRVSTYMGCPSTAPLSGKTIDMILDGTSSCSTPRGFSLQLETARFENRLSKTVAACLEEAPGVSHHVIMQMEEEFANLQRLLYPDNTDLDNFTLLASLLNLQTFYFMPLPGFSEEIMKRNLSKCYNTAETVVRLSLKLQRDMDFLTHAPHSVFRALLSAACVCLAVQRSHYGAPYEGEAGDALVADAIRAMLACSVQDGDIQSRGTKMIEGYWSIRHHMPRLDIGKPGDFSYTHRLGASLAFGCLRGWKRKAEQVRASLTINNGSSSNNLSGQGTADPPADGAAAVAFPGTLSTDDFQGIDWNAFMDDFDWGFTPNYLNAT